MLNTTPAGIDPYAGPNWMRLAQFLIGPSANQIALDANGSLKWTGSAFSFVASPPLYLASGALSLAFLAPLFNSSGSLGLSIAAPLAVTTGTLGLTLSSSIGLSSGALVAIAAPPLRVVGTTGNINLLYESPFFIDGFNALALAIDSSLQLTGNGTLQVALPLPTLPTHDSTNYYLICNNGVLSWIQRGTC